MCETVKVVIDMLFIIIVSLIHKNVVYAPGKLYTDIYMNEMPENNVLTL